MRKLILSFLLSLGILGTHASSAVEYTGENLLRVLGATTNSREFKDFKQYWWLNKNFENQENGIKLFVNQINEKTEGVLLAGENFQLDGTKFSRCSSPLPFGITWEDDTAALFSKLEHGQKLIGRNAMKFYKGNIGIEISFTDLKKGSIYSLKFYHEDKPFIKPTENIAPVKKESLIEIKREETRAHIQQMPKTKVEEEIESSTEKYSPFKKNVLEVFKSYRQSKFYSIKQGDSERKNFWNYKYTYATTLKIEGEKFNMLYSFPFPTSQLDFVSVIKESDSFDKSFENAYREFEKKLLKNFPASEGWVSVCIPNKGSKALSDLEFKNDKYGSIILDYSRNPQGRHVLYMRFLLYSD